jgi:hypothetical protein
MTLRAAITSDIDTLASIYKGQGCRRQGGYTYAELQMGLENFSRFLEPYGIKATLFMVGNDFRQSQNHGIIRAMLAEKHEIANHTMTHAQGFRLLTPEQKEAEIAGMEELCEQVTGWRPRGFRSPGWNISDDALSILKQRGYKYDSSVFPTSLSPLLKIMHWVSMRSRNRFERTTLGHLKYILAPVIPYRTGLRSFVQRGENGIIEFPITVTPLIRVPFFATFLVATGTATFRASYRALKALKRPLQFQFHLSDFVDYNHPELADQVPDGNGVYVPQALRISLDQKLVLFRKAMDTMAEDYTFITLAEWADSGDIGI